MFLPLKSSDISDKVTYRPKGITVKTVSMVVAFYPDVTAGYFDVAVFVPHGSRKKQYNQWDRNTKKIKYEQRDTHN